jgi:hypothetical protein
MSDGPHTYETLKGLLKTVYGKKKKKKKKKSKEEVQKPSHIAGTY